MKKVLIASILLTPLLFGCHKEPGINVQKSSTATHAKTINCSPGNTNNEYDEGGAIHNECLLAVSGYLGLETLPGSSLAAGIENYMYTTYSFSIDLDPGVIQSDVEDYIANGMSAFIDPESVEGEAINSLINMFTPTYMSSNSYCDARLDILAFESNITGNEDLTTSEKTAILLFSSTLRHSLYFWEERSEGNNEVMDARLTGTALADAIGTVVGLFYSDANTLWGQLKEAAVIGAMWSAIYDYVMNA